MALEKVKVRVEDLEFGMYVTELDQPWLESSFLFQGFPVRTESELEKLRAEHQWVIVDREKTPRVQSDKALAASQRSGDTPKPKIIEIRREPDPIKHAAAIKRDAPIVGHARREGRRQVDDMMTRIQKGMPVNHEAAEKAVSGVLNSVTRNPDAAMMLMNLKQAQEDNAAHCVNTAALATVFSRHLRLEEDMVESIAVGAMLHDLGKLRVPKEILEKPSELTEAEEKLMRGHCQAGYAVLKLMRDVTATSLDIVRHHHERVDGKGYPDGLKGDAISREVRVVTICDIYDELISDRPYRKGITPHEALNKMSRDADTHFGKALLHEFIKCVGIYPVGSVVKLSNDAIGMVTSANANARLKTIVMMLLDEYGNSYKQETLVNLELFGGKGGKELIIQSAVDPEAEGLDISQIIMQQLMGSQDDEPWAWGDS
jgi:HD-GYP domain-containing protein (c-di-GMP phosphodiesterase class II)